MSFRFRYIPVSTRQIVILGLICGVCVCVVICTCLLSLAACNCGSRLCDELTGQCICPPRTIKPECIVCEPQTFGCHSLVGCEDCNCSSPGTQDLAEPGCNIDSGQCRWVIMDATSMHNWGPAAVASEYLSALLRFINEPRLDS